MLAEVAAPKSRGSHCVIGFLNRFYFPFWTTTELVANGNWGMEVPADVACLYVLTQGAAWLVTDALESSPLTIKRGDHVVITRGIHHRFVGSLDADAVPMEQWLAEPNRVAGEASRTTELNQFLFAYFRPSSSAGDNPLDIGLPDIIHRNCENDEVLKGCSALHAVLESDAESPDPLRALTIDRIGELLLARTVWAELRRAADSEKGIRGGSFGAALSDPIIGSVLRSLLDSPHRPWTVPEMARMARVSKSSFSSRFHAVVGKPPLLYLTHVRLQFACRLLRESNLKVADIAANSGYESASSFSTAFKRHFGCAPGDYRKLESISSTDPAHLPGSSEHVCE